MFLALFQALPALRDGVEIKIGQVESIGMGGGIKHENAGRHHHGCHGGTRQVAEGSPVMAGLER